MEVVQGMMAEMQKQNAEFFATLARQQFDALQLLVHGTKTTSGMTDTRGIGRPVSKRATRASTANGRRNTWRTCVSLSRTPTRGSNGVGSSR